MCRALALSALFRNSRWFDPESIGGWRRDSVREVDIVTGCFFLLKRRLWERLGGFDRAFFMYGEEADLCLRAAAIGVRCMICPDACIVHYGGASETVRADKIIRLFRAKSLLYQRHWSRRAARWGPATLDLWVLTRLIALSALRFAGPRARSAFETWRSIWRGRAEWHDSPPAVTPPGETASLQA
jgi:GT2 family glycosyltransferase